MATILVPNTPEYAMLQVAQERWKDIGIFQAMVMGTKICVRNSDKDLLFMICEDPFLTSFHELIMPLKIYMEDELPEEYTADLQHFERHSFVVTPYNERVIVFIREDLVEYLKMIHPFTEV